MLIYATSGACSTNGDSNNEQSESEDRMTSRRELISQGIGLMAATAVSRSFVAQSVVGQAKFVASPVDPMQLVNPQFRAVLQSMVGPDSPPTEWTTAMLPLIREGSKGLARPLLPAPAVVKRMIPGPKGAPEVPLYITGATAGASKPAVLHIHGGGFIAGSAADSQRDIQELAANHDCVAISVDYRLAPETPFPGSLEDNYAALLWMYTNAAELGIDRSRIAIKGESAGGGHAAALAIAARDRGEVPLCLQVLIYPALDDRTGSTMPVPPYIGHYIWTAAGQSIRLDVASGQTGRTLRSRRLALFLHGSRILPGCLLHGLVWDPSIYSRTRTWSMGADFCRRVCPRSCTSSLAGFTGSTFLCRRPRYPLPLRKDGMRLLVALSLRAHDEVQEEGTTLKFSERRLRGEECSTLVWKGGSWGGPYGSGVSVRS